MSNQRAPLTLRQTEYPPCNTDVRVVCVEITDIIGVEKVNKRNEPYVVDEVVFSYQLDALMKDGKSRFVLDKKFTRVVSSGNELGKWFQSWSGSPSLLTDEQLQIWIDAFADNSLIGCNGLGKPTMQTTVGGFPWCNLREIRPLPKGMEKITGTSDYVPYTERQRRKEEARNQRSGGLPPASSAPPTPPTLSGKEEFTGQF